MAIYSSEGAHLMDQFQVAMEGQNRATKSIVDAIAAGNPPPLAGIVETIEFHNKRVMDLHMELQAFRLDKD